MIAESPTHGPCVLLQGGCQGGRSLLTRRAVIQHLAATPMLVGGTIGGELRGSEVADQRLPAAWLCDEATGRFWPVADVSAWIDRNAGDPVLRRARAGLVKATDPERRLRLVLRRCGLMYVEIMPKKGSTEEAARDTVRIHHWRQDRGDLRPFFTSLGLARPGTAVQLVNRKRDTISWTRGDEFLYGHPFAGEPALAALVERWEQRHTPSAPVSPDWTAATTHEWLPRWPQLAGSPGIPWAALEAAWRIVPSLLCPNCSTPAILTGFGAKRVSLLGFDPRQEHVCPGCRRLHVVPLDGLDVRVARARCP